MMGKASWAIVGPLLTASAIVLAGCLSLSPDPTTAPLVPTAFSPAPTPGEPPAGGLMAAEAVEIARTAAPHRAANARVTAGAVQFGGQLHQTLGFSDLNPAPAPDDWLWFVQLEEGLLGHGEGTVVIIDYFDGTVLGVTEWIA
jgi:hypothetical protein